MHGGEKMHAVAVVLLPQHRKTGMPRVSAWETQVAIRTRSLYVSIW